MRKAIPAIFISFVLFFTTGAAQAAVITPKLRSTLESLAPNAKISMIVTLADRVDLKSFKDKKTGLRRSKLIKAHKEKADKTQTHLRAFLERNRAKSIKPLWIINGLAATVRADVIEELANQPGVERIRVDETLGEPEPAPADLAAAEWNIEAIRAPELWDLCYTGAGVVVASMDTGVDADHPDIGPKWRGGTNSWYDPNGQHATPYDSSGHGTRVMGIMVGGDASGTFIGVAPDAQWIAVKIFDDAGQATFSAIHQGFQWLLDPDDDPNTNDAPDIVNNSWFLEGTVDACNTEFSADIAVLKAAGIAMVFAAGNTGANPGTSISPANDPEAFAVGAIDELHSVASFSGRGPSACNGSVYPEMVGPGVSVKTSDLTLGGVFPNSYAHVSGTSFAAPHLTGAMALLLSAVPDASMAELETALKQSAVDLGEPGPDDAYGHGAVDVMEAHTLLNRMTSQCTDVDRDGFYAAADCGTELDCNDGDATIYPGAPEIKHDGIDQDCNGYDLTPAMMNAIYMLLLD